LTGPGRTSRVRKRANLCFWSSLPVLTALLLTVAAYPGRWTPDTAAQAAEVETGFITDWYGPLFNALLRIPYTVIPHFGLLLGVQLLLLAVSTFILARQLVGCGAAALIAIVCLLYAPILGWSIVLSRDVWYGAFVLAFAAAVALLLYGEHPRTRRAGWIGAVPFFEVALAVRQNGFVGTIPIVAFAAATLLSRRTSPTTTLLLRTRFRRLAAASVAAVAVVALSLLASRAVVYGLVDARRAHVDQALYLYDLSAASQRLEENQFDPRALPPRDFPRLVRQFNPDDLYSVMWGPDPLFQQVYKSDPVALLREDWIEMVRDEPTTYAAERAHLFLRLIGLTAPATYTYQPVDWSRPIAEPAFARPNAQLDAYFAATADSPLQRPFLYYLAIVAFIGIRGGRGGPAGLVARNRNESP
jgi:hypothetical protein